MNEQQPSTVAASLRLSTTRELRFHRARRGIVVREWRLRDGTWCSCGSGIHCAAGELRSVAAVLQRIAAADESTLRA